MDKIMLLRSKNDDSLLNAPTCYMVANYKNYSDYKEVSGLLQEIKVEPLCNHAVGVIENRDLIGVKLGYYQDGREVIKTLIGDALLKWSEDVSGEPFNINSHQLINHLRNESESKSLIVNRCVSEIENEINSKSPYKYMEGLELINELENEVLESPINLLGALLQFKYKYRGYDSIITIEELNKMMETDMDTLLYFTKEIYVIGNHNITFTDTHPLLGELFENNEIITKDEKYNINRLNADNFVVVFKVLTTQIEGENLRQLLAIIYEMYKEEIGHQRIGSIQRTIENIMFLTVLESSKYIKDNLYKLGGIKL